MGAFQTTVLSKARAQLIVRHPFYANILLGTPQIEERPPKDAKPDKAHGYAPTPYSRFTACTDMRKIYFNMAFIESISTEIVLFVIVHEVMHIVLKHGLRCQHRNHTRWNIACDFAINWMLKKAGFVIWEHALCDSQYEGMSAEMIYEIREKRFQEEKQKRIERLKREMENKEYDAGGDSAPGDDDDSGSDHGNEDGSGSDESDPGNDNEDGSGSDHGNEDSSDSDESDPGNDNEDGDSSPDESGWGEPRPGKRGEGTPDYGQNELEWEDIIEATKSDPELKRQIEREIERKVAQAATVAKMQGKLPGDIERIVQGILNPPMRWQDVLRSYMTAKARDDESWAHRNRRFPDMYLPARHSEAMGEIVVIGDTSGSISNDELAQIGEELREIAEVLHPERIRIIWADVAVASEETFEPGEPVVLHPKGGGGTDMRVPLELAKQYDPIVCLMFTDCYTPWPPVEPPFPLIVLSSTQLVAPIGVTIPLRPGEG
jgi:predicted metal-dependent peptidase